MRKELTANTPSSFNEENSLLIDVNSHDIYVPPFVNSYANNRGFTEKDEHHITVIGTREVTEKLGKLIVDTPLAQQEVLKEELNNLTRLLGTCSLTGAGYYHVVKSYGDSARESIIQPVAVDGIAAFYASFTDLTNIQLGTPFPHITLFVKGNEPGWTRGIGIPSHEAFQQFDHTTVTPQ